MVEVYLKVFLVSSYLITFIVFFLFCFVLINLNVLLLVTSHFDKSTIFSLFVFVTCRFLVSVFPLLFKQYSTIVSINDLVLLHLHHQTFSNDSFSFISYFVLISLSFASFKHSFYVVDFLLYQSYLCTFRIFLIASFISLYFFNILLTETNAS